MVMVFKSLSDIVVKNLNLQTLICLGYRAKLMCKKYIEKIYFWFGLKHAIFFAKKSF